jgi:hypothetical protein
MLRKYISIVQFLAKNISRVRKQKKPEKIKKEIFFIMKKVFFHLTNPVGFVCDDICSTHMSFGPA